MGHQPTFNSYRSAGNTSEIPIHILCVNQYYWPDGAATGQLLEDLAVDLVAAGHRLTVVASRSAYAAGGKLPRRDEHRGVAILRRGTGFGKRGTAARLADYLSFYAGAVAAMVRGPRVDLLFVESTPPLLVTAGALAGRLKGVPLVHVVQDLYPEVAEALGAIRRGGLLAGWLRCLHRWALRRCGRVVVLGEDMRERVRAYGVAEEAITVIPNWADLASLAHDPREVEALKADWGLRGKRVVMYSGNLGRAHTFRELLDAAEVLRERQDVAFLFVGAGDQMAPVQEEAERRGLVNVRFRPYQPRELLGRSLAVGDVHVITQKPETLGLVVPSKVYGILAVGRPVVFVGPREAEVARTLAASGAGVAVAPGDGGALATALLKFLDGPAGAAAGAAGLAWMRAKGDRPYRTATYARLFEEVIGENGR